MLRYHVLCFEELRLGGGLTNVAQAQILPVKAHPRLRMVRATTGLEPAQSHGPQGALLGGMHYHLLCYLSPFGVTEELLRWPQPLRVAAPWGVNRCCMMKKEVLTSADDWKR